MTGLTLRPAVPADAPALAALGRDSFIAKFGHLYSPEDLAAFLEGSHSDAVIAKQIADHGMAVMLAERGGELAGMCKLVLASTLGHTAAARPLELKQLYTAPGQTGGGIGGALMDWALQFARDHGADEIQLSVWSGNTDAQRFYQRHGFSKTADIYFWVGNQRDEEFLFARPLA